MGPSSLDHEGSGCCTEHGAHEIGPSSWHDRHGRARQHRDQSSGARLCFRKWPAGMPLTREHFAPTYCALSARASDGLILEIQ
jgi:hypothetical protein